MADQPQKQTAAAASPPGQKPAGETPTSTAPINLEDMLAAELDGSGNDNEIDDELDPELAGVKPKPGTDKQASSPKNESEEESKLEEPDEDSDDADKSKESEGGDEESKETGIEEAEIGDDEEVDAEKPPKGFENVPKGIWKRQNKLIQTQRELRAQLAKGAIQITPTAASPLADVEDLPTLDARLKLAESLLDWSRENPEGGSFTLPSGKVLEFDKPALDAQLAKAELIRKAAPEKKFTLMKRAEAKPWETAQQLEPKLFDKESEEHKFMAGLLAEAPGLVDHPQWEVIAAYAAKGWRIATEEGSKKARYVRYELDKNGKLIPPTKTGDGKKAAAPAQSAAKPPPATPSTHRPPQKTVTRPPEKKALTAADGSDSDAIAKMLADELGE